MQLQLMNNKTNKYRGYKYKINRTKDKSKKYKQKYGNVNINIIKNSLVLYAESHIYEKTSFNSLEDRCKEIINAIIDNKNVKICSACNWLYTTRDNRTRCEQSFSWSDRNIFEHGMNPRYKSIDTNEFSKTCIYTTGKIFEKIHIITHLENTNPIYSQEELVNYDSLIMAKGYRKNIENGKTRSFGEVQDKYMDIKSKNTYHLKNKDTKTELLNVLDWVLKRNN